MKVQTKPASTEFTLPGERIVTEEDYSRIFPGYSVTVTTIETRWTESTTHQKEQVERYLIECNGVVLADRRLKRSRIGKLSLIKAIIKEMSEA